MPRRRKPKHIESVEEKDGVRNVTIIPSTEAYTEQREALESALNARVLRMRFDSFQEATKFRHKCNTFRVLDRQCNLIIYKSPHPLFGRSVYDNLYLTIPRKGEERDNILTIRYQEPIKYTILPPEPGDPNYNGQTVDPPTLSEPSAEPPSVPPDPVTALGGDPLAELDLDTVPEPDPGDKMP